VPHDRGEVRLDVGLQLQRALGHHLSEGVRDRDDQLAGRLRPALEHQRAGLEARDVQEIADKTSRTLHGELDRQRGVAGQPRAGNGRPRTGGGGGGTPSGRARGRGGRRGGRSAPPTPTFGPPAGTASGGAVARCGPRASSPSFAPRRARPARRRSVVTAASTSVVAARLAMKPCSSVSLSASVGYTNGPVPKAVPQMARLETRKVAAAPPPGPKRSAAPTRNRKKEAGRTRRRH